MTQRVKCQYVSMSLSVRALSSNFQTGQGLHESALNVIQSDCFTVQFRDFSFIVLDRN